MRRFKSLEAVRDASLEELSSTAGDEPARQQKVYMDFSTGDHGRKNANVSGGPRQNESPWKENNMYGVTITELIKKMDFRNLTPEIDADKIGSIPSGREPPGPTADRLLRSFR